MEQWIEATVVEKRHWSDGLYSLRFQAPVEPFSAGQFTRLALEIDGERVARPYSFVNPPHDALLEVYFNEVLEGPLSPRLAALQPGDNLWITARPNGFFTLDQLPDSENLWMIDTGTALGVYLSILRTEKTWQRFRRLVLVHNVRTRDQLSYNDEIAALQATYGNHFHYLPITSREESDGTLHGRILATLEDGRLERQAGLKLTADNSHVMLCGNMGMIREVSEALESRGMRKHRKKEPGHFTTEKYH
ncbi:MAG: ferredoxin--NADP reductase [Candidatus Thiodiazotropha sp. (ex Semelilucina semeliformis)]|nr:ferredoxin--NADP reductase [Candidatus Thiodiazotropha sp. (ex Semelilucina semeliformis)]